MFRSSQHGIHGWKISLVFSKKRNCMELSICLVVVVWNFFFHILGIITRTDFHIFQRLKPPTSHQMGDAQSTKPGGALGNRRRGHRTPLRRGEEYPMAALHGDISWRDHGEYVIIYPRIPRSWFYLFIYIYIYV